ncbi:hypothetical protein ACFWNE_07395 [Streptomyces goshikiensis]|uniref:hypothetical protein n=1 Tax=Streptomyces goshikiensis TaxID=1942 RepID=UPI003668A487
MARRIGHTESTPEEDPISDDRDLDAFVGDLPAPTIDDVLRARREAEQAPPVVTALPMPEFVRGGIVRYRCLLDCGWFHDENPGLERPGPLLLPADFTAEDLSAAICGASEVRSKAFVMRVEQAIAAHFAVAHPGR